MLPRVGQTVSSWRPCKCCPAAAHQPKSPSRSTSVPSATRHTVSRPMVDGYGVDQQCPERSMIRCGLLERLPKFESKALASACLRSEPLCHFHPRLPLQELSLSCTQLSWMGSAARAPACSIGRPYAVPVAHCTPPVRRPASYLHETCTDTRKLARNLKLLLIWAGQSNILCTNVVTAQQLADSQALAPLC